MDDDDSQSFPSPRIHRLYLLENPSAKNLFRISLGTTCCAHYQMYISRMLAEWAG